MKKIVFIVLVSTLFTSCNKKVTTENISKINGYWEIEKVVFPDGTEKEYAINQMFDYFSVQHNKGFRKKVTPQLDGSFLVNDDVEKITIKQENEKYIINYTTFYSKWKEEIHSISDEKLVLINDAKNEYHYKKATSINLTTQDGKTTK
ncbi:hypothetical protein [Flavobacterium luteum]|uniref:Lipocalin family protein n=1 Tax=Flavobacterium luteum TaxID=2026654 RepID=A0A7J5ABQ2_9FLAO|nr:hypothetical protein [Flavobacterium luteum]KAB1154994.1 hypothetical protein F6464_11265 [Flavobacterium luteum]